MTERVRERTRGTARRTKRGIVDTNVENAKARLSAIFCVTTVITTTIKWIIVIAVFSFMNWLQWWQLLGLGWCSRYGIGPRTDPIGEVHCRIQIHVRRGCGESLRNEYIEPSWGRFDWFGKNSLLLVFNQRTANTHVKENEAETNYM